ncbi:MAG TPA: GTPase Era [Candidatus Omnitrophota bacterium]|nr:GTPase Era [Candidatus Omnitrophota bacterium]
MKNNSETRAGYVSIIGRPNVGKSTLLNFLVGEKLAGVSSKPQTTRDVVRGIVTIPNGKKVGSPYRGQIVFLDTPGVHEPHDQLGKEMLHGARHSLDDADVLFWMVYPREIGDTEERMLGWLKDFRKPVFLLVNQIDKFPRLQVLPAIDSYQKVYPFKDFIPISAVTGENIDVLMQKTLECLPKGDFIYPEDQISDQNERFHVRELIREKLYHELEDELPYDATVRIESYKDEEKITRISATIIVSRESQKAIVIGKGGLKIREIGRTARLEIENLIGRKVFLELWVKVIAGWKENASLLGEIREGS